jgi:hypothetical protein
MYSHQVYFIRDFFTIENFLFYYYRNYYNHCPFTKRVLILVVRKKNYVYNVIYLFYCLKEFW